jgi:voltage-gated potassium channel
MTPIVRRLLVGSAVVALVVVAGGVVIHAMGGGRWSLFDAVYMSLISAATVGFGELPGMESMQGARVVTALVILAGVGAFTYLQSALTAFLVEGSLGAAFRRNRMQRQIEKLEGHVVVAGCGSTGQHVVEELLATRTPFVVIDKNHAHLERMNEESKGRLLYVHGDASEDHVLAAAGAARASGIVAALSHDRDNLYVTLSARSINAKARIVSKVIEPEAVPKMLRAGASATVSPNTIGGRRLVSELLRPNVVEFLDVMLRDREQSYRFEEIVVPEGSRLAGRALKALRLREETGALVVGLRGGDKALRFNPPAETVFAAGDVVVVLARAEDMPRLKAFVAKAG